MENGKSFNELSQTTKRSAWLTQRVQPSAENMRLNQYFSYTKLSSDAIQSSNAKFSEKTFPGNM